MLALEVAGFPFGTLNAQRHGALAVLEVDDFRLRFLEVLATLLRQLFVLGGVSVRDGTGASSNLTLRGL